MSAARGRSHQLRSADRVDLLQTITFSSRTLFATDDPVLLVSSFFYTLAGVPPSTWVELSRIRATEQTWNSPARKCLGWADRAGGLLVASLTTACQNRARARRLVVKHRAAAGQLVDEVCAPFPRCIRISEF